MMSPVADPSLPHQVVLYASDSTIWVTCNCRGGDPVRNHLGQFRTHNNPGPIGATRDRLMTQALYNDPHNHVGSVPFTDDYKIRYPDLEGQANGQRSQGIRQGTTD
jgi:hypothetical protein